MNKITNFFTPHVFADENETRTNKIFYGILLISMVSTVIFGLMNFVIYEGSIGRFLPPLIVLIPLIISYTLLQNERVKEGSIVYASAMWLSLTLSFPFSGGIRSLWFSGYFVLIILIIMLLGERIAFIFTGLSILAGTVIFGLELIGMLPEGNIIVSPVEAWVYQIICLIATSFFLYTIMQNMQDILYQTKASEQALRKSNTDLVAIRGSLEERIAERTRMLEIGVKASHRISTILDEVTLIDTVVQQIQTTFNYDYVKIYLFDEANENVIMEETSILAVPIASGENVLGVIHVRHDNPDNMTTEAINFIQSIAHQMANTLKNIQYIADVRTELEEARRLQERYMHQSWEKRKLTRHGQNRSLFGTTGMPPPSESVIAQARQESMQHRKPTPIALGESKQQLNLSHSNHDEDESSTCDDTLVAPIVLRDAIIGDVQLHGVEPNKEWTEDELALIDTVVDQVAQAAENLQLFDEIQERASREALIGQISDKMRRAPDIESLMEIAVSELSNVLKTDRAFIRLGSAQELSHPTTNPFLFEGEG